MKRTIGVMAVLLLIGVVPVFAASVSAPTITSKAAVSTSLELTVQLWQGDPFIGTHIAGDQMMDFGSLTPAPDNGGLVAGFGISALIIGNSHSLPFTVTQTASSLTSGANMIPDGAFRMNPVYVASDNGGAAVVGTMGSEASAVGTGKAIYTSAAPHALKVLRCYYSIPQSSPVRVPLDQPGGAYQGTVVITITA